MRAGFALTAHTPRSGRGRQTGPGVQLYLVFPVPGRTGGGDPVPVGAESFDAVERIGSSSTRSRRRAGYRSIDDYLNGLNLYRANMPAPVLAPTAQLPHTRVPVQVLAARQDYFVTPALQRFTGSIPARSRVVPIEGGHWVVSSRPDVVARLTGEWVDQVVEGRPVPDRSAADAGRGDVRGKLALVTGAGAGIGRATAVELARQGARTVVVVDRDLAGANETADAVRAAGAEAAVYQVDVSDEAAMNSLAAQVHNKHGVVDILVNNAGIGMAGRFWRRRRRTGTPLSGSMCAA